MGFFVCGNRTMEKILEIINVISTTKFLSNYDFINNYENKSANLKLYKKKD